MRPYMLNIIARSIGDEASSRSQERITGGHTGPPLRLSKVLVRVTECLGALIPNT